MKPHQCGMSCDFFHATNNWGVLRGNLSHVNHAIGLHNPRSLRDVIKKIGVKAMLHIKQKVLNDSSKGTMQYLVSSVSIYTACSRKYKCF